MEIRTTGMAIVTETITEITTTETITAMAITTTDITGMVITGMAMAMGTATGMAMGMATTDRITDLTIRSTDRIRTNPIIRTIQVTDTIPEIRIARLRELFLVSVLTLVDK
jgi:hypothetical protein